MLKKKIGYLILFIMIHFQSISICSEIPFKSQVEFIKWVSFYYLNPEPQKIGDALKYFCNSSIYKKSNARVILVSFTAIIFKNNEQLMIKIFEDVSLNGSENEKIFTSMILQLINSDRSRELLNKIKTEWKLNENNEITDETSEYILSDILEGHINDPNHINILWAVFNATGDALPVKKIISAIQLPNTGRGLDLIIGNEAEWSLINNAYRHKKVYEICKEEIALSRGLTLYLLENIIKEIDERQNYGGENTFAEISIEELGKYTEQDRSWGLALSGILLEINEAKIDTLILDEITSRSIKDQRSSIKNWWGDENREDFLGTLDWLYNEGHSRKFNALKIIMNTSGDKTVMEICEEYRFNDEIKNKMLFIEKYNKYVGNKSLLAYDLGRYVNHCKSGYQAGYISEDEEWMKIMAAAKRARSIFVSWEEFGTNYIIGRRFWKAGTDEEEKVFEDAVKAYSNLLDKNGIWAKIPWDIDF